jgi:hypothetical protein
MGDRPILFSAPMVRALLAGTKTQTRRVLALRGHKSFSQFGASDTKGYDWHFRDACMRWHDLRDAELRAKLRIAVGDRLYVREAFSGPWGCRRLPPRDWPVGAPIWLWSDGDPLDGDWTKPKPGIHMPRWASRLTLLVTDIRVQRLQDCSEEDAIAEGVDLERYVPVSDSAGQHSCGEAEPTDPIEEYRVLWGSINGAGSWADNPWIVAISFTVHQQNIDAMEVAHG